MEHIGNAQGCVRYVDGIELRNHVPDLTPPRRPGCTGDDDLIESECHRRHREIDLDRLACADSDLLRLGPETNAFGVEFVCARHHVEQDIATVLPCEGPEPGARYVNLDLTEGLARLCIGHLTDNLAVLRLGRYGEKPCQSDQGHTGDELRNSHGYSSLIMK